MRRLTAVLFLSIASWPHGDVVAQEQRAPTPGYQQGGNYYTPYPNGLGYYQGGAQITPPGFPPGPPPAYPPPRLSGGTDKEGHPYKTGYYRGARINIYDATPAGTRENPFGSYVYGTVLRTSKGDFFRVEREYVKGKWSPVSPPVKVRLIPSSDRNLSNSGQGNVGYPSTAQPSPKDCMAVSPTRGMNPFPNTWGQQQQQTALADQRYPAFSNCMRRANGLPPMFGNPDYPPIANAPPPQLGYPSR